MRDIFVFCFCFFNFYIDRQFNLRNLFKIRTVSAHDRVVQGRRHVVSVWSTVRDLNTHYQCVYTYTYCMYISKFVWRRKNGGWNFFLFFRPTVQYVRQNPSRTNFRNEPTTDRQTSDRFNRSRFRCIPTIYRFFGKFIYRSTLSRSCRSQLVGGE